MNTEYPLTLVEFKSWLGLGSKEENEVVGVAMEAGYCPIATALSECKTKNNLVEVGNEVTEIDEQEYPNPEWVVRFVSNLDDLIEDDVTAKEALQIVNNLYICTVCNQYNPEGTNCGKKDNCPW